MHVARRADDPTPCVMWCGVGWGGVTWGRIGPIYPPPGWLAHMEDFGTARSVLRSGGQFPAWRGKFISPFNPGRSPSIGFWLWGSLIRRTRIQQSVDHKSISSRNHRKLCYYFRNWGRGVGGLISGRPSFTGLSFSRHDP
jgi:hypothetical protein